MNFELFSFFTLLIFYTLLAEECKIYIFLAVVLLVTSYQQKHSSCLGQVNLNKTAKVLSLYNQTTVKPVGHCTAELHNRKTDSLIKQGSWFSKSYARRCVTIQDMHFIQVRFENILSKTETTPSSKDSPQGTTGPIGISWNSYPGNKVNSLSFKLSYRQETQWKHPSVYRSQGLEQSIRAEPLPLTDHRRHSA